MSIVLPLKRDKSHPILTEGPDFATWSQENLVNFAKDAHEKMRSQEEEIQTLRLDIKAALEGFRAVLREE
jgi:hypothetical protein